MNVPAAWKTGEKSYEKPEFIRFQILLTAGEDGEWYIYPDSPMVTS